MTAQYLGLSILLTYLLKYLLTRPTVIAPHASSPQMQGTGAPLEVLYNIEIRSFSDWLHVKIPLDQRPKSDTVRLSFRLYTYNAAEIGTNFSRADYASPSVTLFRLFKRSRRSVAAKMVARNTL